MQPSPTNDAMTQFYYGRLDNLSSTMVSFFHQEACEKIFPFLEAAFRYGIPLGKYPLLQEEEKNLIFAHVEEGIGKGQHHNILEAHNTYIDIHATLQGIECIGVSQLTPNLHQSVPYDKEKDICFFDETPKKWLILQEQEIAVIPPGICHAPLSGDGFIKKIVIKVHHKYSKAALCNISLESV